MMGNMCLPSGRLFGLDLAALSHSGDGPFPCLPLAAEQLQGGRFPANSQTTLASRPGGSRKRSWGGGGERCTGHRWPTGGSALGIPWAALSSLVHADPRVVLGGGCAAGSRGGDPGLTPWGCW